MPDIVRTTCEPEVIALSNADVTTRSMLAYLRAVGRARPETISTKLGKNLRAVKTRLSLLMDADIIILDRGSYSLAGNWRSVLPEILTIEVKVADWRRALYQAARNRIFSHLSFVALPESIARRVRSESLFRDLGIGLLSIDAGHDVRVLRKARRVTPKAWIYYYSLASLAADHLGEDNCDFRSGHRERPRAIS